MPDSYPSTLRPLPVIAFLFDRDMRLLRRWIAEDRLEARACWVPTRAKLYDVAQAAEADAHSRRRRVS